MEEEFILGNVIDDVNLAILDPYATSKKEIPSDKDLLLIQNALHRRHAGSPIRTLTPEDVNFVFLSRDAIKGGRCVPLTTNIIKRMLTVFEKMQFKSNKSDQVLDIQDLRLLFLIRGVLTQDKNLDFGRFSFLEKEKE